MTAKSTRWTAEKRARAAERMRQTKPWLKTTGPKTPEGKDAVRLNAWKHGLRSAEMAALSKLLTAQTNYVRAVLKDTTPPPNSPRFLEEERVS